MAHPLQVQKVIDAHVKHKSETAKELASSGSAVDHGHLNPHEGALADASYTSMRRLRSELDPVSINSRASEFDILVGMLGALALPRSQRLDLTPDEMAEKFWACPAITVKHVEVSCKTNQGLHTLERVLLRSLRLLPSLEELNGTSASGCAKQRDDLKASTSAGQQDRDFLDGLFKWIERKLPSLAGGRG